MRSSRQSRRAFASLLVVVISLAGFFSVLRNSHGQTAGYDQLIADGRALLKGGKTQEAAVKAKAAADLTPDRFEAYELAAMIGMARKDNQSAKAFLDMAVQRAPEQKRYELYDAMRSIDPEGVERAYRQRVEAGRRACQEKAFAKAGKELYEAWKIKPSEVGAAFEAASAYVAGEDYPLTVTILRELARSKEQKAADEAKRFLDKLKPMAEKKAAAYYQTGNQLLTKGDNDGAIENLNQAILLNSNLVLAFNDRGLAYFNKGEIDRAIQDYDQALKLNSNFAMAFHNRGKTYMSKGQNDRALQDLDQAMKLGPSQGEVLAGINKSVAVSQKPEIKAGDDGVEMVQIPAGEFWMGNDSAKNESPRRQVYLDAFWIDKYEVTVAPYSRFKVATGRWQEILSSNWPAGDVGWPEASAYCAWVGKRLPTEAEWEKAARGTDGRKYPWGDQSLSSRANTRASGSTQRVAVGSFPTGVSPYGVHDMVGNVSEWVADWYDENYYRSAPNRNPKGPASGRFRVMRGNSYDSWGEPRVSHRSYSQPVEPFVNGAVGFRCAQ